MIWVLLAEFLGPHFCSYIIIFISITVAIFLSSFPDCLKGDYASLEILLSHLLITLGNTSITLSFNFVICIMVVIKVFASLGGCVEDIC